MTFTQATANTPQKLEMDPTRIDNDVKGGSWVRFERRGLQSRRLSRQGSAMA